LFSPREAGKGGERAGWIGNILCEFSSAVTRPSSTLKESLKLRSHAGFRTLFLVIVEGQRKCEVYTAGPVYHGGDVHEVGIAEKKEIITTFEEQIALEAKIKAI
jgi:hypothetical protein